MINFKIIFFILGVLISVLSISMTSFNFRHLYYKSLSVFPALISSFFGLSLILAFRNNDKKISVNDTILITVYFTSIMFFASIPFFLDANVLNFSEAFFEATSWPNNNGATIYNNVESFSKGL